MEIEKLPENWIEILSKEYNMGVTYDNMIKYYPAEYMEHGRFMFDVEEMEFLINVFKHLIHERKNKA